jgi:diaminohydroxyphosphoribosylaminopyrimidine deaminase/5-amino-6-(5-phosphoribosylamino)uracil reductase
LFTTQPNPRVGCVLSHAGVVVGEGWHERAGAPHAEVHALRQAGPRAQGATAHVTLEPCAHFGRTGPCADALIAAGVARVVIAAADPFPAVDGAGIERLRAAGIAVEVGLLAAEARALNPGFYSRMQRQRPWVRVKLGLSLDARSALSDGRSQWITGADARADVQRWRARSSAILTGIDSVLADDPRLNVRLEPKIAHATPLRVVLDSAARLPTTARLLTEPGPILWVTTPEAPLPSELPLEVEHLSVPATHGRLNLARVLLALAERGCNEVLVEAGPTLAGALVAAGLVDELLLYLAPKLLGDSARAAFQLPPLRTLGDAGEWQWQSVERVGDDLRLMLRAPAAAEFLVSAAVVGR